MRNPNVEKLADMVDEIFCDVLSLHTIPAQQRRDICLAYAAGFANRGALVVSGAVLTDEAIARLPEVPRYSNHAGRQRAESDVFRAALSRLAKGETT